MMQVLEAGHCPFRQLCPLAGGRGSPVKTEHSHVGCHVSPN